MPSGEGKKQGTFTEVYVLPYSLIAFYGVVNENAAESTKLQAEDINLLSEGMWNGTKNLLTRSKVGQMPRLLLQVEYEGGNYHIGDLDKKIKFNPKVKDELSVRDISDVELDFTELKEALKSNKDRIKKIRVRKDDSINLDLSDINIPIEKFDF